MNHLILKTLPIIIACVLPSYSFADHVFKSFANKNDVPFNVFEPSNLQICHLLGNPGWGHRDSCHEMKQALG